MDRLGCRYLEREQDHEHLEPVGPAVDEVPVEYDCVLRARGTDFLPPQDSNLTNQKARARTSACWEHLDDLVQVGEAAM